MREMIAVKATELPMLIRESRQFTTKETAMALRGTSQPGLTFGTVSNIEGSYPYDPIAGTYVAQKRGEWEASIACEGKHLARSGGCDSNGGAE